MHFFCSRTTFIMTFFMQCFFVTTSIMNFLMRILFLYCSQSHAVIKWYFYIYMHRWTFKQLACYNSQNRWLYKDTHFKHSHYRKKNTTWLYHLHSMLNAHCIIYNINLLFSLRPKVRFEHWLKSFGEWPNWSTI